MAYSLSAARDKMRKAIWDEHFEALAQTWRRRLHLVHWEINWTMADVVGDDPNHEAQVSVRTQLGHEAEITIAERIADRDVEAREEILVHELVHIILDELSVYALTYMEDEQHCYFERLMEIAVSDVTHVLLDLAHEGKDAIAER